MDQLVLRPWRPRVFCWSRRRLHSRQFQPARLERKNHIFQRSDADDSWHRKPRLWRLKRPELPRNLPIRNGLVWSHPCSLYSFAAWTRIDEGEVSSGLIRLLPTRPLRTPKRASNWSIRGTVNKPCESLLPKMPRRLYTTLKATRHWRRLLREQFPSRFLKSKSFQDITCVQSYTEQMPSAAPKFIPKIYGFKIFGMRGSKYELKFDYAGKAINEDDIRKVLRRDDHQMMMSWAE